MQYIIWNHLELYLDKEQIVITHQLIQCHVYCLSPQLGSSVTPAVNHRSSVAPSLETFGIDGVLEENRQACEKLFKFYFHVITNAFSVPESPEHLRVMKQLEAGSYC